MHFYELLLLLSFISSGFSKDDRPKRIEMQMSPEQGARLIQFGLECLSETGVNPELLFQAQAGHYHDTEQFRNFIHCTLKKARAVSKDGHIKINKILAAYPKHVDTTGVRLVLEECNKAEGETPQEIAYKASKCYYQKTPIHLNA